jgi:preprotein translocase subunit SecD
VQPTEAIPTITEREMEAVQTVVEGRVNGLGVSEAVVQQLGNNQLLVQLPGVSDPEQAERVLGGTPSSSFAPSGRAPTSSCRSKTKCCKPT